MRGSADIVRAGSALAACLLLANTMSASAAIKEHGDLSGATFGPGEQLTYRVAYLGLPAGSAEVTVGAEVTRGGRSVWPIVAVARTEALAAVYPLRDMFVSYFDYRTGRTVGSDLLMDENRRRRRVRIDFGQDGQPTQVLRQREGQPPEREEHALEDGTIDLTAVAFVLRREALKPGDVYELPVFTGARSFRLVARVEGAEVLSTTLGDTRVLKVRVGTQFAGKLAARSDLVVYLTADRAHVPVRVEADFVLGKLVAEMTSYKPGRTVQ